VSKISTGSYKAIISMPYHRRFRAIATDASNSPFFEDILDYEFPKKVHDSTFDCYSGQNDPVQHLHQYQNKMVTHSRNDSILCRIFPSGLKGIVSDWSTPFRNVQSTASEISPSYFSLNTLPVRSSSRTTITSSLLR